MRNAPLISQEDAARRIEDALRLRVGRGRRYSYPALSDATCIPTRTLESYVQGSTPGLHTLLSLCAVLGPSFTSDVIGMCGQTASAADCDGPEHLRVLAALGTLTAEISRAIEDGQVDHREAAQLRPLAQDLIEILEPLTRADGPTAVPLRGVVS